MKPTLLEWLTEEHGRILHRRRQMGEFVRSESFGRIEQFDQNLIRRQLSAMATYEGILQQRIERERDRVSHRKTDRDSADTAGAAR